MEESDDHKKIILVAVDESEESMYALSWCLHNLLQAQDTKSSTSNLMLLYVKPPPPVYSSLDATGYFFGGDVIANMEKYRKDLATSVMRKAETIYRDFNIQVEKKVGTGDAKDVICLAVEKFRADMLVMGSHNYGFFKRALLGSVSEHCAKHVKCPVVVVKTPCGSCDCESSIDRQYSRMFSQHSSEVSQELNDIQDNSKQSFGITLHN